MAKVTRIHANRQPEAKETLGYQLGESIERLEKGIKLLERKLEDISDRFETELKKIAPAGVNVWWETLREPNFDLAIGALAARGRMIVMAGREARPPFPVGPFYVKGCLLRGFVMFMATPDEQRDCAEEINRWLAEGKLKPTIDRVLPLSQAAPAHRLQEESTIGRSGVLTGKIVLKP